MHLQHRQGHIALTAGHATRVLQEVRKVPNMQIQALTREVCRSLTANRLRPDVCVCPAACLPVKFERPVPHDTCLRTTAGFLPAAIAFTMHAFQSTLLEKDCELEDRSTQCQAGQVDPGAALASSNGPCGNRPPLHMHSQGCLLQQRILKGPGLRTRARWAEHPRMTLQRRLSTL